MKKVIKLLKSGNFTLLYHDLGLCTLHPGKIKYEQSCEEDNKYVKEVFEFNGDSLGYTPHIVEALVKALGGKVDSI